MVCINNGTRKGRHPNVLLDLESTSTRVLFDKDGLAVPRGLAIKRRKQSSSNRKYGYCIFVLVWSAVGSAKQILCKLIWLLQKIP